MYRFRVPLAAAALLGLNPLDKTPQPDSDKKTPLTRKQWKRRNASKRARAARKLARRRQR